MTEVEPQVAVTLTLGEWSVVGAALETLGGMLSTDERMANMQQLDQRITAQIREALLGPGPTDAGQ